MRTWKMEAVHHVRRGGLGVVGRCHPSDGGDIHIPEQHDDLNKASNAPLRPGQTAPYVEQVGVGAGSVTLRFHGAPAGVTYFEVRTDGFVVTSGTPHEYLLLVDPVLYANEYEYPGVLVQQNEVETETFNADSTIEARLALGGENDWLFDWVAFGVPSASVPYGDITVSGGYQMGHFPEVWSLSACDLTRGYGRSRMVRTWGL